MNQGSIKELTSEINRQKESKIYPSKGGKFLTFFLENEEYGLEILKVMEIIEMMNITPVPNTPNFIRGIINLRGKIIPIMDLRLKFGMPFKEQIDETVIIIVQACNIEMGIVVDRVSEVVDISSENIEDTPSFGIEINTNYILGVGKSSNNVKLLLEIDKVLTTQDVLFMQSTKVKNMDTIQEINACKQ